MTPRRVVIIAVALTAVVALAFAGWPASRYLQGDFIQYYLGGRALLEGRDPYDPATWRALHDAVGSVGHETAYFYPLVTAVASLPVAVLPVPLAGSVWFVAQTALVLGGAVALTRRLFPRSWGGPLALLLVLMAIMEPAFVTAGEGNVSRHLAGLVGVALALATGGAATAAGALLGVLAVKPHLFLLFVPCVALALTSRERARLLAGFAATLVALLAASLAFRPGWFGEWLDVIVAAKVGASRTNLYGMLPPELALAGVPLAAVCVGLLAAWWWRRRPGVLAVGAVSLALSLWLAPYAAPYDQGLLLTPLAVLIALLAPRGPLLAAMAIAIVGLAAPRWLSLAGSLPGSLEPLLALPPGAAFVLLLAAETSRNRTETSRS